MHSGSPMSETNEGAISSELPLDFTLFLSGRLGLDPSAILSTLGNFLLSFERDGLGSGSALRPSLEPAVQPSHH